MVYFGIVRPIMYGKGWQVGQGLFDTSKAMADGRTDGLCCCCYNCTMVCHVIACATALLTLTEST